MASADTTSVIIPNTTAVYTHEQVAELAQVDPRTLTRWAALKQVPGRIALPGRSVRYSRAAIDAWLTGK
jgi:predicted DNA-binding transcriptional regulator AlpA